MTPFNLALIPLPLGIRAVEHHDPLVLLMGSGWSLSLACPWHVLRAQQVDFAWSDEYLEDTLWGLVGIGISAISVSPNGYDPVFELSDKRVLLVSADTDLDPWVLKTTYLTIVGSGH